VEREGIASSMVGRGEDEDGDGDGLESWDELVVAADVEMVVVMKEEMVV